MAQYKVGKIVKGNITGIEKYGIFVNLDNFYSAINRAALLTQNKDKNLINMKTAGNELVITSFASEIGKSEESVAISKNNDGDITISYSAKYMLDALKTLNDDEICAIVAKEVKKRKESVKEYEDAGREDIANSLKQEVEILSKYLPEQLTEDEIEKLVVEAISESGATSPKDMGRVMSILRPKTAGKADGKLVSDIVKEKLANM